MAKTKKSNLKLFLFQFRGYRGDYSGFYAVIHQSRGEALETALDAAEISGPKIRKYYAKHSAPDNFPYDSLPVIADVRVGSLVIGTYYDEF